MRTNFIQNLRKKDKYIIYPSTLYALRFTKISVHIISGKFKGYKLKQIPQTRIRPTMDRVRESVFSMIKDKVDEAVVLDLFAGSGSLGLEVLSEGGRVCHFVDNSFHATRCIKENLNKLRITDNVKVVKSSALSFIKRCEQNYYDIIFVDPPYKAKVIIKVVNTIYEQGILKADGLIVAECGIDEDLSELEHRILKTKVYGDTKISLITTCL